MAPAEGQAACKRADGRRSRSIDTDQFDLPVRKGRVMPRRANLRRPVANTNVCIGTSEGVEPQAKACLGCLIRDVVDDGTTLSGRHHTPPFCPRAAMFAIKCK